jgi:hypothetical protein
MTSMSRILADPRQWGAGAKAALAGFRPMTHEPHSMSEVVEGLEELADGKRKVCLGDALDAFGKASFGPVLIVLPLIELSPVGGIPGLPTALAVLIALIALQLLLGRDHLWIPALVERRSHDRRRDHAAGLTRTASVASCNR